MRKPIIAAIEITLVTLIGAGLAVAQSTSPEKPLMAEQVFKNVRVLKGIPVDDFMETMGLISAALSFDCSDCHEGAGTDKVDWAADTPRKVIARTMVNMVATINKNNFGGRQEVTCWTCHRNRDKPLVTPALETITASQLSCWTTSSRGRLGCLLRNRFSINIFRPPVGPNG